MLIDDNVLAVLSTFDMKGYLPVDYLLVNFSFEQDFQKSRNVTLIWNTTHYKCIQAQNLSSISQSLHK